MRMSNELNTAFTKFMGCPCTTLQAKSEEELTALYLDALKQGKEEGFVPVIIFPDETLWEGCKFNSSPDEIHTDLYDINLSNVADYRKLQLQTILEDGQKLLKEYLDETTAEYVDEYKEPLPEGKRESNVQHNIQNQFLLGMNPPFEVILAKIPKIDPWEVFAFVPFGNWNDCPDTPDLMAVSKYWYEKYQAYPAVICSDTVNYYVEKPATHEQAMELAFEQFAFCRDVVEQGTETIALLADCLTESKCWFFWWD